MNRLKIFAVILLLAVAGVAAVPYFLPTGFKVQKTIVLPVKPYSVFPHLNNLAQWERWSAWSQDWDPTISRFYRGPAAGQGAECSWKGEKTDGKVHIIESRQNELLAFDLLMDNGRLKTASTIQLSPENKGTRITWISHGPETDYFGRIQNYFLMQKLEQDFERGLNGLNEMLVPQQSRLSLIHKKTK